MILRISAYLLLGLLLPLSACPAGGKPQPVEIVWNEDSCVECRMAISDRNFACEVVSADGICSAFDDLGCLVVWVRKNGLPESGAAYVRDFNDQSWVEAQQATYLYSRTLPTPMSYGLAAFKTQSAAEAGAKQWPGQVWDWEAVLKEWQP
jgi:copper chaperone NosL